MNFFPHRLWRAALTLLAAVPATSGAEAVSGTPIPIPAVAKKVDFEANVLPIFKRNCLACHNQTDAEGELVLETPATIAKGGENGPVVVPRQSAQSSLLKNCAREAKPYMPPKNNKVGAEVLKPDELAIVKAWIDQGATGTVKAKAGPLQWRPLPPGLHPILAVAVSADGQFAACGRANQIFIYHVSTGQMVARLTDPKLAEPTGRSGYRSAAQRDFVQCLAFSPDGHMLASAEFRMVKLWQREPNLPQFTLGSAPATAVAVSPDGRWIATAAADRIIRLWSAATGQQEREIPGQTGTVRALKFSPDSARLACGAEDRSLGIWELKEGKLFAQAETMGEVTALAWVLGGKQLATGGGDTSIHLWQPPPQAGGTLAHLKELTGHGQPVSCLESSATDGRCLVSGSGDGTVRYWNVESAKQLLQREQGAPVSAVAISPNGKTLASAGGNSARLWVAESGQAVGEIKGDSRLIARIGEKERALELAKSRAASAKTDFEEATKAQAAKSDAVKKTAAAKATAEKTLAEQIAARDKAGDDAARGKAEEAVKTAQKGQRAAVAANDAAALAAKQAEQALAAAKAALEQAGAGEKQAAAEIEAAKQAAIAGEKPVRAVAFLPGDLTVATAGDDQAVHTWSAVNGAGFETYPGQIGRVQTLLCTPDGRLISCAAEKGAVVWRTAPSWTLARSIGTGDEKSALVSRVLSLDFSADSQILATGGGAPSRNGEVKLWRVGDASLVREIANAHSDTVFGVAFSPDGKTLATASADKFVKLFDVAGGKLIKALSGHTHYVLGVNWRPDGRGLASAGADKAVKLWSFPAGEQLKTIQGFNKEVTSVRFYGPAGGMLTSSGDTKVRLLKEDGGALRDLAGGKGYIFSTAITPDSRIVLGGGQDSTLRIWEAATGKALFTLDAPPDEAPHPPHSAAAKPAK